MTMRILFSAATGGRNGAFVVQLVSPEGRRLDVRGFLKRHGLDKRAERFTYRDPGTDIRRFADAFFKMLGDLLETDLRPAIEGRVIEETPIDWMGYK
jgi:hypothetical protein